MTSVGVAIPSIPVRPKELARALTSVCAQTRLPDAISVAMDYRHEGAAVTRNRAWRALGDVDYLVFLDDDDELLPEYIEKMLASALETGADLTYAWMHVVNGWDPFAINGKPAEGHPFNDEARKHELTTANHIAITVMVRREAMEKIDGFPLALSKRWPHATNEDWGAWTDLLNAGFTFHHLPERLWLWNWNSLGGPGNTSGKSDGWVG